MRKSRAATPMKHRLRASTGLIRELIARHVRIKYNLVNPKSEGTRSAERYDLYKVRSSPSGAPSSRVVAA